MSSHTTSGPLAAAAGSITIGDDLTVNRMGFGAMRLTGRGIWGPPPIDRKRSESSAAPSSSASIHRHGGLVRPRSSEGDHRRGAPSLP